jgi:NAD(P)-dependent dehydrogenase (short-subunit alcohol dehydrogenase family)
VRGLKARDRLESLGRRTAVITGAASGLGRALALELARDGWTIGIVDVNEPGAEQTLRLVEEAGGAGEAYPCDVRDSDRVVAMADHFFGQWGTVSLLINNAGIAAVGFVGEIDIAEWRRSVDVNVMGTVNGCHAFVPRMKAHGGGHIVNIASSAGIVGLPEMAPYNMTKAAVISLSETLRAELALSGIGVTVACPTFFDTNLLDTMTCTDPFQTEFAHSAFENSKATPDDIARGIIAAARRGKLYVMPQSAARWTWATKRLSPAVHHGALAWIYRAGIGRSLLLWMARRGLC